MKFSLQLIDDKSVYVFSHPDHGNLSVPRTDEASELKSLGWELKLLQESQSSRVAFLSNCLRLVAH